MVLCNDKLKKSWLGSRHSAVAVRLELIKAARRDARQRKLGYEVGSPVAGAVSVSCCRLSTSCSAWRLHWSDAVRRGSYLGRTKLGAGGGRPWYQPGPAEGKGSKYFPTLEQWAGGWPRGWRTGVAGRRCAPDLHSLRHPLFVYLCSLVHHLTPNCPSPSLPLA